MTLAIPIVWYWASLLIGFIVSTFACALHIVRYGAALLVGSDPLNR